MGDKGLEWEEMGGAVEFTHQQKACTQLITGWKYIHTFMLVDLSHRLMHTDRYPLDSDNTCVVRCDAFGRL